MGSTAISGSLHTQEGEKTRREELEGPKQDRERERLCRNMFVCDGQVMGYEWHYSNRLR